MSSDEEFVYDDGVEDDDFEYNDDDDDSHFIQHQPQQQQQQAQNHRYQPPPAPLPAAQQAPGRPQRGVPQPPAPAGLGGAGGLASFLHPGAFQAGFGGHAFARPPASAFRRQYKAYSTAILESQQGRSYGGGRANLMFGGKIVMPPSALDELTQLDIEFPIDFEISNPAQPELTTHVGVLEFIAQEGTVNLPQWVMDQLRLNEGEPIRIWGGRYPKGKMIKIQAQSVDFLEVSDPKAVLEQALRNFSVLSAGDIIEIGYQTLTFRLLIMEITPPGPAISVIDTDVEVDFAAPLGYVEPDYEKLKRDQQAPTMKDKFVIDTMGTEDVDAKGSGTSTPIGGGRGTPIPGGSGAAVGPWEAFKGSGHSVGGKRVKGKGVSGKKIEEVDAESRIIRTDQPRIITADTQIGGRQVPARLDLPFGNLFFGYENIRPPPGSAEAVAEEEKERAAAAGPVAFAGVGNGNTLSGRQRSQASTPGGAPTANPLGNASNSQAGQPSVPFSGEGRSLGGGGGGKKKKPDVIVID
ncbi:UFD1-domain-containing protein [Meredithblackwellia eburnea MCA 4105]